jgi:hypothetical protein
LEFLPKPTSQPARAKLPRVAHTKRAEHDFAHIGSIRRSGFFSISKEPVLSTPSFVLDHLDRTLPPLNLSSVQFSKVQQTPLDNPIAAYPHTLAKRVIDMLFLILANHVRLQKHAFVLSKITALLGRAEFSYSGENDF